MLVTALTKRLAEDLSAYFSKQNVRCKWLHSELDAFERVELLRDLRKGEFDVLVGSRTLAAHRRTGSARSLARGDLGRADKEGFLRSETSLMQTIGRSARERQRQGAALHRADRVTEASDAASDRRDSPPPWTMQRAYNTEHGITPATIRKAIHAGIESEAAALAAANAAKAAGRRRRRPSTSPTSTWPSWKSR